MKSFFQCKFGQICLVLALSMLSSCEPDAPLNPTGESHFPPKIEKIMRNNCTTAGCHNQNADPSIALDLTTWEKMFAGSSVVGAVTVPYDHNWSHLFQHINTYSGLGLRATPTMPPAENGAPLDSLDVLEVKNWILNGAPASDGRYYWSSAETRRSGKLFVLCSGDDRIAVVDVASNRIMRYIPVGVDPGFTESPHYVAISPDEQYIYVTLIAGGAIEKYRTDNYQFAGRVQVNASPSLMVFNQAGTRLVVSHWNDSPNSEKMSIVNTENMTLLSTAKGDANLLAYGHGLAVSKDFSFVYVCANSGNYIAKYSIANQSLFTDEEKFSIDPNNPIAEPGNAFKPYQLLLTEDESQLFVSCSNSNEVRVIRTDDMSVTNIIPTDSFPRLMTYDPQNKRIFVACAKAKNTAAQGTIRGCVGVINLNSMTLEKNIYAVGQRPHGIFADVARRKLYVSSENTGGQDPPHHATAGSAYPPGKFHVIDLNSLDVLQSYTTEVAGYPTSLGVTK